MTTHTNTSRAYRRLLLTATFVGIAGALAACDDDDHGHGEGAPATDEASELFNEAFEATAEGKADTSGCSGVVVPDQNYFDGRVALTFDDGPNPETTPIVLDTLERHGIQATFFINGSRVNSDAARAVLQRILDDGHILANHSHTHQNLRNVSSSELARQVDRTTDIIEGAGAEPTYFRFPYGSSNCSTAQFVRERGYVITGWHVDSGDWCFSSGSGGVGNCPESTFAHVPDRYRGDMIGYTIDQTVGKNGGILLFHDIHRYTAESIDTIITQLLDRGFTFTNIDDLAAFPLLHGETPPERPFVGTQCESDDDCGFDDGYCFDYSDGETDTGFCTLGCEGTCPDRTGFAPTFCVSLDGETGNCVSKSSEANGECTTIPGTSAQQHDRYIGSSGAPDSTAVVCVP